MNPSQATKECAGREDAMKRREGRDWGEGGGSRPCPAAPRHALPPSLPPSFASLPPRLAQVPPVSSCQPS
jgi:hypothetical protein